MSSDRTGGHLVTHTVRPSFLARTKSYLYHLWLANLLRVTKRKFCCEQRVRWTPYTVGHVRESTNNLCFYCRTKLDAQDRRTTRMHIDHYVPWSKGGSNLLPNLVPACMMCNMRKTNMLATRFTKKYKLNNTFCRYKHDTGRYCENSARKYHKYCVVHSMLPYNWVSCS